MVLLSLNPSYGRVRVKLSKALRVIASRVRAFISMHREAPAYDAMMAKVVLAAVLVVGFIAVAWCWLQPFDGCAIENFHENQKLGLNVSADIVKLLLTLQAILDYFLLKCRRSGGGCPTRKG